MSNNSRLINNQIHKEATIWNYTDITNSNIEKNAVISDFSQLRSSVIRENADIGRRNTIHHSVIGKNTYTGEFCMIKYAEIGKYCAISWNVSIGGADHDINTLSVTPLGRVFKNEKTEYCSFEEKLKVGNDVWIAAGSHILRGVTIGDGAVIGANSVVTHDVEPYSIVVGAPAKVIGYRFDEEIIDRLRRIKWWDFSVEKLELIKDCFGKELNDAIIKKMEETAKL